MSNYTPTGAPPAQTRGISSSIRNEFALIATAIATKADTSGQVWTGIHDFTGATISVPSPTLPNQAVPKSYVDASIASSGAASAWVSGSSYLYGALVFSPINLLTYRRKIAGAGTTDPSIDSTNWQLQAIGAGGQTITGSVTLASSSSAAITVTPSSAGLYATLPDATTCSTADNLFSIYNAGDHDYGVKDSTGTKIGWVRPRTGAMIGLSDKSTAAGTWAYYGLAKSGITAQFANNTITGGLKRITLDANRALLLLGSGSVYAVVYDASTGTFGSPVLVRASIGSTNYLGVLSATDQVLVASCTSTTGFETVALTISGTTVTVNTAATATLGGNIVGMYQFIAVGSSFVISYVRATTTTAIRAITVSGTTVTIGAESTLNTVASTNSQVPAIFASGSVVRTICATADNTTFRCAPYTVSGSTLSVGTGVNVTTTNTAPSSARSFVNGNGNIVFIYTNTNFVVTVFKLTSTTEAASTVTISATVPTNTLSNTDYGEVSASKTALAFAGLVNIITDTAGTATVGTAITVGSDASNVLIGVSGNNATFVNNADTVYTVDCSGSSPVLSSAYGALGSGGANTPNSRDTYGVRAGSSLYAGASLYAAGVLQPFDRIYTANGWNRTPVAQLVVAPGSGAGVSGAANNESWIIASRGTGCVLQRLEAAA